MATTEEWIEWARRIGQQHRENNHQLYLWLASSQLRYYRNPPPNGLNWGHIAELANADHYWMMRYFLFSIKGASGMIVGTVPGAFSPMLGEVLGRAGAVGGGAVGTLSGEVLILLWDVMKQFFFAIGHPELVPGDSGRPSPPSAEQIA